MTEGSGAVGGAQRRRTALTWLAVFVVPIALGSAARLTTPRDADRSPAPAVTGPVTASSVTAAASRKLLPHGGALGALLLATPDLPEYVIALPDCCFYEDPRPAGQDEKSCETRRSHPATKAHQTAERTVPIRFPRPAASAGLGGSQVLSTYSSPASAAAAVAAYRDFLDRCQVLAKSAPGVNASHQVLQLQGQAVGNERLRSETRIDLPGPASRVVSYLSMARVGATLQQIMLFRELSGDEQELGLRAGDLAMLDDLERRGLRKVAGVSDTFSPPQ